MTASQLRRRIRALLQAELEAAYQERETAHLPRGLQRTIGAPELGAEARRQRLRLEAQLEELEARQGPQWGSSLPLFGEGEP